MLTKQFARFVVVGGISTLANFAVFWVLHQYASVGYLWASACGFVGGVVLGFFLNRSWTFEQSATGVREVLLYGAVYLVSLGENLALMPLLVEGLAWSPVAANVLTIGVTTVSNFLGTRLIVFRSKDNS